ncbi:hypothetical protein BC829DRAFT_382284 [Chytridium lagenaria]|nr:hypothetical protein BC829DRAFT_382284 [Chytridium lagenaria]
MLGVLHAPTSALPALTWGLWRPLSWLPSILWAVPKKRQHTGRRLRMNSKWLRPIHVGSCPFCGKPKMMHNVCSSCFKSVRDLSF